AGGEGSEDAASYDVTRLCEELESEARLRERGFKYRIEGDSEVHVRPNAFSRLVSNLVSNAFRPAQNVELSISHVEGWLKVVVDDDGPGIPEDRREDVFKPFVRLDEARTQDSGGTGGLGLAIARDIARSHGGDISLEDSPLGGLRAIIHIPA